MSISGFSPSRALALLPFGYLATSRLKSARDVAFLVATSWLPAIWLIVRLEGASLAEAIVAFLAGYLALIAVYEIGYLVNDLWDARRSDGGRVRFGQQIRWPYAVLFVAIRLACWASIGIKTGWILMPLWLAGYVALLIAFAQHNLVQSTALRLASFLELATLRFLLPIVAIIPRATIWVAILAALALYAYPRFLAYLDSKGVLQLPERQNAAFGALQLAWLAPLLLFIAYAASAVVLAELLLYFVLAYGLGSIGFGRARQKG